MKVEVASEREDLLRFVVQESLQSQSEGESQPEQQPPPKLLCLQRASEARSSLHRLLNSYLIADRIPINRVSCYQLSAVLEAELDGRQRLLRGSLVPPSSVPGWKAASGVFAQKAYVFYELSTTWIG